MQHARLERVVALLAAVSVVFVATRTVLLTTPEPFPGLARMGDVGYDLALAYLAGWIFHLLVVVLPRRADRRRVHVAAVPTVDRLAATAERIGRAVANASGQPWPERPAVEALSAMFGAVAPYGPAPLVIAFEAGARPVAATWLQYLNYELDRASQDQDRLVALYPYLDSDLIVLLRALDDSPFVLMTRSMHRPDIPVRNVDLSVLADSFSDYLSRCDAIKSYRADLEG